LQTKEVQPEMTEQAKRERRLKNDKIIFTITYLLTAYLVLHFGTVAAIYGGFQLQYFNLIFDDFNYHLTNFPVFIPDPLAIRYLAWYTLAYFLVAVYYFTTRKKFMVGKEYGTAQWGGTKESKPLRDKDEDNNIIFTKTEWLSLNKEQTNKNLNAIIVGGPGTGKTRFYVKPNVLQAHTSYVISDPNGDMLRETGAFLQEQGYKIKVLNLVQREYSDGYNPFHYMHGEIDVFNVIYCIMENTTTEEAKAYEQFWEKAEVALLGAVFYYVWYEYSKKDQTINAVLELLRKGEERDDDDNYESELDRIFARLAEENPNHIAVKQYTIYKQSSKKTSRSILVSASARLAMFNLSDVINITATDTLELDRIGEEKTALFVVISDAYMALSFITALLYTQFFETALRVASESPTGKLKIPVRCILDEFILHGKLIDFERLLSSLGTKNVSVSIIVKNLAQLKTIYEGTYETIMGNCDSLLFLGSLDQFTLEHVSRVLGRETIDTSTYSLSKQPRWERTGTTSYDVMGRELMLPDELARMPDSDCILIIRGTYPFYSKKYDVKDHKNFKYTYESDPHYLFDYRTVRRVRKIENKVELSKGKRPEENELIRERGF